MSEILHSIPPVYSSKSRVLILGSFPSVRSREAGFFYGHPQNRFWRVLASLFGEAVPQSIDEKKAFLQTHGIALWDVIASCEIVGSSDASIRNAVPNDLSTLLETAPIRAVFTNGATADRLYRKYLYHRTGIAATCLPSTSPANAAWSQERLQEAWRMVLSVIRKGEEAHETK